VNLGIVGGSESSGTTLLAHLLSKHPEIVSGPEMKFFNHPEALSLAELRSHQTSLFDRRRLLSGYHAVPTFLRAGEEFGIDREIFRSWLAESTELRHVYDLFARHMCEATGTTVFVEKTPSNVYGFKELARLFPDIPLIHEIRDGRDVVASLMNRKKSLFRAASLWLYDTLSGLRVRAAPCCLETRYEDLVNEPNKTLTTILTHLGLEFDEAILDEAADTAAGAYKETWLDRKTPRAWNNLPSQPVSPSSIGRYRTQLTQAQLSTIYRVRLTDRARDELEAPVSSFGDLLGLLGYGTEPVSHEEAPARITERRFELREYRRRARTTLRYEHRLPRPFTTIGPARAVSQTALR
jgi:hypothetical protein